MSRFAAALVFVAFTLLATTDPFLCPDGCQSSGSLAAADHCDGGGLCVFCTGTLTVNTATAVLTPVPTVQPAPPSPISAAPIFVCRPLEHPPRLA